MGGIIVFFMTKNVFSVRLKGLCGTLVLANSKGALREISSTADEIDLKGRHSFILFYLVYLWRTLPPF